MASNETLSEKIGNTVNERLINGVVCLLGMVFILLGIMFSETLGSKWEAVVLSVGASLVASAVVSYLSSIYIYKRNRTKEITETWGVNSISDNRSQMNIHVTQRLDRAKDYLDVIAYGLKSFRESKGDIICEKLKHGMKIRIITVDPECKCLEQRDLDEKKVKGSTADSIAQLCRWVTELQNTYGDQVEIKFCQTLHTEVYFRVDDYIYTGPYQYGKESQQTITMEFRGPGKGYSYYKNYFDKLWNDKEFCNKK